MSARPNSHLPSDLEPYRVRLSEPGEIAAAVPQLLGFRPSESVVLIGLGGRRGDRVGLTVRADIPRPAHAAEVVGVLVRSIRTQRPGAVVVAVVSEAPDEGAGPLPAFRPEGGLPHRELLRELTMELTAARLPVRDALLVRSGRWWSYDCSQPCCAPGRGTALPGGVTALEAAAVVGGMVVEGSRRDLERRLEDPDGRPGAREACIRWAGEGWAQAAARGSAAVTADAWAAVGEAMAACRSGPGTATPRLTDDLVARVVWGLRDTAVRDRALALALTADPAPLEDLWTQCTRRAPAPLDAAPATLLAVSAWLRGDGAMANIALERALDSDPDYRLAGLLAEALARCLRPTDLRAMISETATRGV
jgi:hypothetical protein